MSAELKDRKVWKTGTQLVVGRKQRATEGRK